MTHTDQFGFLNYPGEIRFKRGWIEPCADFSRHRQMVAERQNLDGFMYPPEIRTHRRGPDDAQSVEVPNSLRPAPVFVMPASHALFLPDPLEPNDIRHGDGGLLLHLTAFFFGIRLQFSGWRFDGRVPTESKNNFLYTPDVPAHFIDWAYEAWRTWDEGLRRRYTNILYMHTRTDSCLWEWDRFTYRYMVFDAIWKFHAEREKIKRVPHGERVAQLCSRYQVPENAAVIDTIVRLRNELFHEALWDGGTPGQNVGDNLLAEKWLGNLNAKLIVAMTGYLNEFTRRGWWFFGLHPFDKYSGVP